MTKREGVHPGEIIVEEFLIPLGLWGVIEKREPVTEERAHVLALMFGTTPEFWMNLQDSYDERTSNEET